ncbi:alpha/beta hydrolase [Niallia sp. Krafla_26]|uniref:alpha/beta hydrolase n=1 Tax=Niallia sp. Krafla_26 TaxID=3064703 RepID=UPI003D1640D1
MKKFAKIVRFLFSFLLFLSSFGVFITNRMMYIKKKDDETILNRETSSGRFRPEDFQDVPRKDVTVPSPFGYHLKVILVEPHQTNRYMVISHGVTENKVNSIKYMKLFLERGFNVAIYDHRRHGESGGKTTSYGYYEKFDLKAIVHWLKNEKGSDILLGIHGESMGAATMLLYAGAVEDGADFYISDCAFSDFSEQISYLLKKDIKVPPKLVLPLTNTFLRIRERYSLHDISPISFVHNIKHPVLFIHSKKDDYILPAMTEALYEKKKGPKKLFLAENGAHAQSLNENKEDYEAAIDSFLQEFIFSKKPSNE